MIMKNLTKQKLNPRKVLKREISTLKEFDVEEVTGKTKEVFEDIYAPKLTEEIKDKIKAEFLDASVEKVGVVVQEGEKQELRMLNNISDSESVHYIAEPQQHYDALNDTDFFDENAKRKLVCFVHNHPFGSAHPSGVDVNEAYWEKPYVIVSKEDGEMVMRWFVIAVFKNVSLLKGKIKNENII